MEDDKKPASRMGSIETASLDVYAKYVLRSICQQVSVLTLRIQVLQGNSGRGLFPGALFAGFPCRIHWKWGEQTGWIHFSWSNS